MPQRINDCSTDDSSFSIENHDFSEHVLCKAVHWEVHQLQSTPKTPFKIETEKLDHSLTSCLFRAVQYLELNLLIKTSVCIDTVGDIMA